MEAAGRPRFGALLRQFRLDAGMTQQELAERANLSADAVSTLERGARTRPYRETIVLLGRALDLSPEREALLASAIGIAHPPRRRREALNPTLLRIVRPELQTTPRHNLPQQLTSLVGRDHEIAEIAALLREHRVVTVVGAGGVGKTRVAMQTGSDLVDGSPDGVWLVDLAPLADQTLVASAILNALHLPSSTGPALEAVIAYLKTRGLLLILDNCEHVIAEARELAVTLVASCPTVRILATSREPLRAPGEHIYRLPSLPVPPDSSRNSRDALRYGAVALFVDRALSVDAGFALTEENAQPVAEICRRLDGIPLAIELAAARADVLAPAQIAQRLDKRFRLLTGGNPHALPRHQTMTALFDWSYDLLTPREQRFFEWLSVFAGGFNLEAAASVCATDGEDELAVIDLVASLATKSLLLAELVGDEQRYHFLESSRQYARNKLMTRGEQEQAAQRHALIYLELAEQLERAWSTMPELVRLAQARVELANWRVALDWALAKRGDVILGQRLAASRKVLWNGFTLAEGRRWVREALGLADERTPPGLIARLEHAEAEGSQQLGERKVTLAAAERALVRYRELGDALGSAHAQVLAGTALVNLGRLAEGEPLLTEALATARTLGNRPLTAAALEQIGVARSRAGDFAGSRAYFTEAIELEKVLGQDSHVAILNMASNEFDAGDPETALRLFEDVLSHYGQPDSSPRMRTENIATALVNMTECLLALGRYDEARVQANQALVLGHAHQLDVHVATALQYLALVAIRPQLDGRRISSEYAGIARLLGFVGALRDTLGIESLGFEHNKAFSMLRDAIAAEELTHLMAAGAKMTEGEAIAQANALEGTST